MDGESNSIGKLKEEVADSLEALRSDVEAMPEADLKLLATALKTILLGNNQQMNRNARRKIAKPASIMREEVRTVLALLTQPLLGESADLSYGEGMRVLNEIPESTRQRLAETLLGREV